VSFFGFGHLGQNQVPLSKEDEKCTCDKKLGKEFFESILDMETKVVFS
jgi:hypothetical protein